MDKVEELMAAYPDLHFIFDKNMPEGQQGLYIDDHIYLNPKQSKADLLGTMGEEIGHYLTSAGDITAQDTNESVNRNVRHVTLVQQSLSHLTISSPALKRAAKRY